jgi:YD repeat-containing protein
MTPSRVGGVYLGGSGQTLAGAGLFDGITLDRNNNLVLIGKGGAEIKLPPLRLDDMVTIFRSVYLHGEGPSVTIDPSPENPEGSAMIIRHGKATENTYVGWVLYHADRLMKGYTLGIDNVTGKSLETTLPGHAEVLRTIFFGGENPDKLRKDGHWQRFWIVPAESRRFVAPKTELTLFDVPLEVKTQSMKWEKGKLVDDTKGQSSPGALAFKNWFTSNYDAVARERLLTPPRESGITQPVPVFTELRRIALMTAIAEKLRDQGVPMPFWMRDYEVRPVPFEKITPGLLVTRSETRSNERLTARIYGGVNLSVADKDARTYTSASDLAKAPSKDTVSVRQNLALAGALEEAVRPLAATSEPVKVRTFAHAGTNYQAAALPGAETQALAPARIEETDLVVPVPGREPIRLVRSYNSFFDPAGPWGKGWALDLPRLDELRVPGNRTDKGVEFRIAYELVTPLNSVYVRFARVESVAALNGSRLQVPDQPGDFLGLADGKPEFLTGQTRQLIRKDGGSWHFSKSGELVAIEQSGSRVVYERDEKGRVSRIVGLAGRRPVATIDLRYDASGRIERATAKGGQREASVRYEYDANGKLAGVVSDSGRLGYRYTGSLLTEVTGKPAGGDGKKAAETVLRRFEYGPRGRLTAETGADGTKTDYRVSSDASGSAVTATSGGKAARSDVVRYDPALRPVQAQYADGTQATWSYPQGGGLVMDLTPADGRKIRLTEAADQRSRSVQLAPDRKLETQYDAAGRLTSLNDNGQPVLRQKWAPDGRLLVASNPTSAANFDYSPDGLVSRVLLAPPGESGTFKVWQATRLDEAGRPLEVTDYRGLQTSMDYTGSGELRAATVKRDGKNYGFQIDRDPAGRVREVKSSWGASQYAYDPAGLLTKVDVESMGQKSSAEWKSGLLQKVRQFDGGELSLKYYDDKKRAGLPKEIVDPNRLALAYDYDASNRLSQVAVGSNYRLLLDYDSKGRLASWNYAAAKR